MANITWVGLLWCSLPVFIITVIYFYWQGKPTEVLVASARMVLQLLGVGYLLVLLFEQQSIGWALVVLTVMISAAAWIAIRPVSHHQGLLGPVFCALGCAVGFHLYLSLYWVLDVPIWYEPRVLIPLAGMYFANGMNAISLAAERYYAELEQHAEPQARITAFRAAMIPQINGLLAVGIVALPGMMTGQILSGVSPLVAVRYQIMIMAMVLGTAGMGAAMMLWLLSRRAMKSGV